MQQAASPRRLYLILHITMRGMVEPQYDAAGCISTASLLDTSYHFGLWYDLHNHTKRSTVMLRRLLNGLGIVEISLTVVILLVVVVAIRQVLQ